MTTTVEAPAEKVDLKQEEPQVQNPKEVDETVGSPTAEEKEKLGDEPKSPAKKAPAPTVHKTDFVQDTVYLYQFARCPTIPSASPFCLKVETFLRMAGISYENVDHKLKYKSKKGQLPFIELNGKEIADSDIIIRELSEYFNKNLDEGLTPEQKVSSHAFESMLNNHTSWVVRWWRYNNPKEFLDTAQLDIKQSLQSRLPKGLLNFVFKIGFRSQVKQAVGHGLGRHTTQEIYDFGKEDLSTLSQFLGDKDYFFGAKPHLLDCVAFAHVAQFVYVPFADIDQWLNENHPNLVAFVQRVRDCYWPDWERACKTLELNTHLYKEGELPPLSEAEKKALEVKKAKEEAKKAKEEEKKAKAEQKKKEKEEKERKKAEEAERKKAEKEKAEKEKAEKEAAAKEAAAAAAAAAEGEAKTAETEGEGKPTEESKPAEEVAAPAAAEEKKE